MDGADVAAGAQAAFAGAGDQDGADAVGDCPHGQGAADDGDHLRGEGIDRGRPVQGQALFREAGAAVGAATALTNLGDVCTSLGRHDEAAGYLSAARDIFRTAGHAYGEAVALTNLGRVHGIRGDHARAIVDLTVAIRILRSIGHRYGEASALNILGDVLTAVGRTTEAVARHAAALSIATATGDHDEQEHAHEGIARAQREAVRAIGG